MAAWWVALAGPAQPTFSKPSAAGGPVPPGEISPLLTRLAAKLAPAAAVSRGVLLGQRDPRKDSCIRDLSIIEPSGQAYMYTHAAGGPGSRLGAFLLSSKVASIREDFRWSQTDLRAWLRDLQQRNVEAQAATAALSDDARALSSALAGCQAFPPALKPVAVPPADHWPATCLARLNAAVAARDLPASRRWADELAAAAFGLNDLHRWIALVASNGQDWLDFQARCQGIFDWTDDVSRADGTRYDRLGFLDRLPGATLIVPASDNLREVERQAERLFQVLPAYVQAAEGPTPPPAAMPLSPDLREVFLYICSRLSPADQETWNRAAASPYYRSYLTNILYRAMKAQVVPELALSLRRLGRTINRPATIEELMDVAFYRGGEICSGLVWADRFDLRLMETAGEIRGDNEKALLGAHALTNRFLGGWGNYTGGVWTLEKALDDGRFDCVRGTDMIGSLYRNAGYAGYRLVRLTWGMGGHSVAGSEAGPAGQRYVRLVDSLVTPVQRDVWPSAYFRGHEWPEGYPGPRGPVYAAELYLRGLDSYLFAEGYVIRGPNAGTLARATLAYLPDRQKASFQKAYAGPYPPMPKAPPPPASRTAGRTAGPAGAGS